MVYLHGGSQAGKLTGAVDYWWQGDGGAGDELLADLAAFGLDKDFLPDNILEKKDYEVWPEHKDAVSIFLKCQTQWRVAAFGVVGLDYGPILQIMDLYDVDNRRQTLEDLQIMESRAKELINKALEPKQSSLGNR